MEDVPLLVDFALKRLAQDRKAQVSSISPEALVILMKYDWPGNVRELENAIYRSAVMAQSDTILIKDLPRDILTAVGAEIPVGKSLAQADKVVGNAQPVAAGEVEHEGDPLVLGVPAGNAFDAVYQVLRSDKGNNILEHAEQELIQRALQEMDGKQVKAAEILGMTRATLRKRMDRYGLNS